MPSPARAVPETPGHGGVRHSSGLAPLAVATGPALLNLLIAWIVVGGWPEMVWGVWLTSLPSTGIAAWVLCRTFRLPGAAPSRIATAFHYGGMAVLAWLGGALILGPVLVLLSSLPS